MWLGGIFSALEPVPLVVMVFDALRIDHERRGAPLPQPAGADVDLSALCLF